jgi:hypothetical protein
VTLLDLIKTSGDELTIQITRDEDTWNEYDTLSWDSRLLDPVKEYKVDLWEAIAPDVIRVQLNYDSNN